MEEYDQDLWEKALEPVIEARVIKCRCGKKLSLDSSWANECEECGREYNGFGQLLAPRSQWGEETGEIF